MAPQLRKCIITGLSFRTSQRSPARTYQHCKQLQSMFLACNNCFTLSFVHLSDILPLQVAGGLPGSACRHLTDCSSRDLHGHQRYKFHNSPRSQRDRRIFPGRLSILYIQALQSCPLTACFSYSMPTFCSLYVLLLLQNRLHQAKVGAVKTKSQCHQSSTSSSKTFTSLETLLLLIFQHQAHSVLFFYLTVQNARSTYHRYNLQGPCHLPTYDITSNRFLHEVLEFFYKVKVQS